MKRFLVFLAIGSFFATVEEFLTVVVLRHDVPSYVFTLIILFPVFLSVVWLSSRLLDRYFVRAGDLAHFLVYGSVGLLMEWTLMGLAPLSDPKANPLAMFVFQLGMFAFWATVATAPRVFLDPRGRVTRRRILKFYVPYFTLTYVLAFSVPARAKFATIISLILLGYLIVGTMLFLHALRTRRAADMLDTPEIDAPCNMLVGETHHVS